MRSSGVLFLFLVVLVLSSCSISRNIPEGEAYYCNHSVEVKNPPQEYSIPDEDLLSLNRLQPNRRILFVRFNLRVHTWLVPQKALRRSMIRANERCVDKNRRRASRNKAPKECRSLWSWLAYTVGEPPAILDSSKVEKAADQMTVYLQKLGYFNARVTPEYVYNTGNEIGWKNKRKVRVRFNVTPGTPYRVRNIKYTFDDPALAKKSGTLLNSSILDTNMVFNLDQMEQEGDRITAYFNDNGYFEFTRDYLWFDADSSVGNYQVDLTLRLRQPLAPMPGNPDSLISVPHRKYFIGDVFVRTDYNPLRPLDIATHRDSVDKLIIESKGKPSLKPELLSYTTSISEGELYRKEKIDLTYRRFTQLGTSRSVTIQLTPKGEVDSSGYYLLDAHILMAPAPKQSLSFDPRVTNRSGNMGIYSNLVYRHKNLFKGAESFEARIVVGAEASQILGGTATDGTTDQLQRNFALNTFEVGPEIDFSIPRLFPLGYRRTRKSSDPRANFRAMLNYQRRPDYERTLSQFSYGWSFIENPDKVTLFNVEIAEISLIKIQKSAGFQQFIDRLNDDFLANSYRDHLITASRIAFTLNTQKPQFQKRYMFYRSTFIEWAGNMLRGIFAATGQPKDEFGSYELGGIRFAQYVKSDHDVRGYFSTNERNTFVLRGFAGVGLPLNNLDVLPFEKSYFGGGANGIRSWQARTLGPGSFRDTTAVKTFNNIGDVKLEFNFEYRFKLTQMFNGAFFVDAGNIWLINGDDNRPGAEFKTNRFLSELAIGTGFGVRLDFEFFLVRVDLGIPLKDPLKVPGERWVWQPKDEYNEFLQSLPGAEQQVFRNRTVWNVGIGFPF